MNKHDPTRQLWQLCRITGKGIAYPGVHGADATGPDQVAELIRKLLK